MAQIAKLFRSGRSQAVLLPDGYRFDCDEVEISRDGDTIVLRPRRTGAWTSLEAALEAFDADRFAECFPNGREQPPEQERSELDDWLRSESG